MKLRRAEKHLTVLIARQDNLNNSLLKINNQIATNNHTLLREKTQFVLMNKMEIQFALRARKELKNDIDYSKAHQAIPEDILLLEEELNELNKRILELKKEKATLEMETPALISKREELQTQLNELQIQIAQQQQNIENLKEYVPLHLVAFNYVQEVAEFVDANVPKEYQQYFGAVGGS